MIIGFGKTEIDNEVKELTEVFEIIKPLIEKKQFFYYDDKLIELIKKAVNKRQKELMDIGEKYKKEDRATVPERYFYYWANCIATSSKIIICFSFHHINRNHAFSPDGWAMWARKGMLEIEEDAVSDKLKGTIYTHQNDIE